MKIYIDYCSNVINKNDSYFFRNQKIHSSRYTISEHGQVSGRKRSGGIVKIEIVRPRPSVSEKRQQFAVHNVFHNQ